MVQKNTMTFNSLFKIDQIIFLKRLIKVINTPIRDFIENKEIMEFHFFAM